MPDEHGDAPRRVDRRDAALVDDANVLVMLDQPEQTAQEIGAFLKS